MNNDQPNVYIQATEMRSKLNQYMHTGEDLLFSQMKDELYAAGFDIIGSDLATLHIDCQFRDKSYMHPNDNMTIRTKETVEYVDILNTVIDCLRSACEFLLHLGNETIQELYDYLNTHTGSSVSMLTDILIYSDHFTIIF
jgi:hypothetical protein